jgi:glycosyltransferase involved in cell wall biosynthesis
MSKVAIVSYDFFPSRGGQGRHAYGLWRHLRESLGADVHVFSPSPVRLSDHTAVAPAIGRFGRELAFSLAASLSLSRWADRHSIDLFHFNGGPGGVFLLRPSPVRYLYSAHHTYAQEARLVAGQDWKSHLVRLEANGYLDADLVAADSRSTARSVVEELGVPAARVEVVPSGIDGGRFRPRQARKLKDAALFVGRLDDRKGLPFLLTAWRRVLEKVPGARLYVIGEGPLRRRAERQIVRDDMGGTVAFLGRVSEDRLIEWYNAVSCVVTPSALEGFGRTALESVFCGTPVVATDCEGLRDVLEDGEDGRLAPCGDEYTFSEAICEVFAGKGRLPAPRVKTVRSLYDWSVVAPRFQALYDRILSSKTAAAGPASPTRLRRVA